MFEKVGVEPRVALELLQQQWGKIEDYEGEQPQQPCRGQQVKGNPRREDKTSILYNQSEL